VSSGNPTDLVEQVEEERRLAWGFLRRRLIDDFQTGEAVLARQRPPFEVLTTKFGGHWLTERQRNNQTVGNYQTAMAFQAPSGAVDFILDEAVSQMASPLVPFVEARSGLERELRKKGQSVPNLVVIRPSDQYPGYSTITYCGKAKSGNSAETRSPTWSVQMTFEDQTAREIMSAAFQRPGIIEEMFQMGTFGPLTRPRADGTPQLRREKSDRLLMVSLKPDFIGMVDEYDEQRGQTIQSVSRYLLSHLTGDPEPLKKDPALINLDAAVVGVQCRNIGRSVGEVEPPSRFGADPYGI